MIYRHRFLVQAPLARVAEFHRMPTSMAAITPPPIIVRLHAAPPVLAEGSEMEFTMWLGPFPLRWLARMENVSPTGFSDRQLRGPFAEWIHHHTFRVVDDQTTEVRDEINLRLRPHPIWGLVGAGMRLGLPVLFAYRQYKTRRLVK